MAEKKTSNRKATDNSTNQYLFYYNLVQLLGWSYILSQVITFYLSESYKTKKLWYHVKYPVIIFQAGAVLEVVHILTGLVKTSVMVTASQVYFRLFNIFGILQLMPPDLDTIGVIMTMIAWTSAEITRYLFYVFKETGSVPYFILWIRYTAFIVLVPLGLGGELVNLLAVQSYVAENNLMNFKVPFCDITLSYRHILLLLIPLFLRGFVLVYSHMLAQRRKVLNGDVGSDKRSK